PIAFNFPTDLMWAEITAPKPTPLLMPAAASATPDDEAVQEAAAMIAAARRPVVLAGRDAIDDRSRAALLRLADRIEAPLATTLRGKNLFRGEDYNLGYMGTLSSPAAGDVLAGADCILAFGAALNFHTTAHGGFTRD